MRSWGRARPTRPVPVAVNQEYWRCKRGTIFCGGRYYATSKLCERCDARRRARKRGEVPGDSARKIPRVFTVSRNRQRAVSRGFAHRSRCPRWGDNLAITFSGKLFASRKRVKLSYARWIYERVAGPLPSDLVVVALRGGIPQYEDLIVVRRSETRHGVARYLHELDMRSGRTTPF